jgi:EAL and modified HD-GYP domain-containing signal transduction protein
LFFKLLQGSDIPDFAARRMAVIPVHLDSLTSGRYRFLAAPHSVFQIDLALIQSNFDEVIVHLQEARRQGCQIAMTGFSIAQHTPQLLKATDLLFLKMSDYSLLELQGLLTKLKTAVPALGVVVEGVPTWAEQRMCLALGVKYCLGDFVSSVDREEVQEGMMAPGRIISIEMLNLLRREAELGELSQVAKKDPGITLQLLKWANSPMAGLRNPVTSMDQAIMVLGRETLYRWLTMSIFRMGKEHKERDESLLEVALTRARFLETVASPDLPRESRDELFLVGMLSLFEVLLSMPMEKILAQMTLPESVSDVLLRSSGPYGRYLRLAMVMERGRSGQIADLAQTLGISVEDVQSTNLSAFNWAQEALAGENASTRTLQ